MKVEITEVFVYRILCKYTRALPSKKVPYNIVLAFYVILFSRKNIYLQRMTDAFTIADTVQIKKRDLSR